MNIHTVTVTIVIENGSTAAIISAVSALKLSASAIVMKRIFFCRLAQLWLYILSKEE